MNNPTGENALRRKYEKVGCKKSDLNNVDEMNFILEKRKGHGIIGTSISPTKKDRKSVV